MVSAAGQVTWFAVDPMGEIVIEDDYFGAKCCF